MTNTFEKGDRVKICWKKDPVGYTSWAHDMDKTVGEYGKVVLFSQAENTRVELRDGEFWSYHPDSLVKVNEGGLPIGMVPRGGEVPCVLCGVSIISSEWGFCSKHRSAQYTRPIRELLHLAPSEALCSKFSAEAIRDAHNRALGQEAAFYRPQPFKVKTIYPLPSQQQQDVVHTQNKSLMLYNWVELLLPDGRIASPPMPLAKDGWMEDESYSWPEKYEARAIARHNSSNEIFVRPANITEGEAMECFKLDPVFMGDMRIIIEKEPVFIRAAKRFSKIEIIEPPLEPYNYPCPSQKKPQGNWPIGHSGGIVERRK